MTKSTPTTRTRPAEAALDYRAIVADASDALGKSLSDRAWTCVPPKAGPNAVHKIMIPAARGDGGFVITVADRPDTPVIRREADVLKRLHQAAPPAWSSTIPELLACRRAGGVDYFVLPWYTHTPATGWRRRLTRRRRTRWTVNWLTELARATRGATLDRDIVRETIGDAALALERDASVPANVRSRVVASLSAVDERAAEVPSVCCHGDLWSGNLLWNSSYTRAVVLDWGAARWPGLPAVDLCRFLLSECRSDRRLIAALHSYCAAQAVELSLVPALYDLYLLFVKSELDTAYADAIERPADPFSAAAETQMARLRRLIEANARRA